MKTETTRPSVEDMLLWAHENRVNLDLLYAPGNPAPERYVVRLRPWENKPGRGVMWASCGPDVYEALATSAQHMVSGSDMPLDFAWRGGSAGAGTRRLFG